MMSIGAVDEAAAQSMFRGDAAHTGVAASQAPRSMPRVKWSFPTGQRLVSSPVWHDGAVIFGSDDGNVYAVDAASGRQRWMQRTGGPVSSTPAVAGGRVYVLSYDGRLDALMHNQQGFQSSPAVVGGVVYCGSRDAHVYALDAATGQERWRFSTGASWVNSSPAVQGSRVHFATSDSALYQVLDAANGRLVHQHSTQAYVFSSPTIGGDVVLVGVLNGVLQARDKSGGALLWEFQTEASRANRGWALTADKRFNSAMLFPTAWHDGYAQGAERQQSTGSFFSTPLVMGGVVFIGSADGRLYALE
jgi:outer membrane protein assembly factor BamB